MEEFLKVRVGILYRYFEDLKERDALNNADITGKQEEEISSLKSSNDTLRKQNSLLMKDLETSLALTARYEKEEAQSTEVSQEEQENASTKRGRVVKTKTSITTAAMMPPTRSLRLRGRNT